MITLVVSPHDLRGDEVRVGGHAYRHLFRARRLAEDAVVRVVDGEGKARCGRVVEIAASSARLVLAETAPTHEPARRLELMAPIPKASRLSWMVEKATEVGVSAIRLMQTERAPRQVGIGTLERLGRVAVAAVEQSHRSLVPSITGAHLFCELPDLMAPLPERWFLQPGAGTPQMTTSRAGAALLVGPEGGWSAAERDAIESWGCRPLGLGPTILRIETAAVVGCAGLLIEGIVA